MTEEEWLAATDPEPMLAFLKGKASDRKLRLFAVACCRRIWHLLTNDCSKTAVNTAEMFADGIRGKEELAGVRADAEPFAGIDQTAGRAAASVAIEDATSAAWRTYRCAGWALGRPILNLTKERDVVFAAKKEQTFVLRDIFGNPFQHVVVVPEWLTSDVLALATGIYAEKAFDRLPILANVLQDAGCENEEVLNHCRGPGPHVRGCYILDMILGKS